MCECVCYCAYFYYANKLYVHVCVLERAKHSFFALPNPLSCSVTNKICLNQEHIIQIYFGITHGRVLSGELYTQRLQKSVYLCLLQIKLISKQFVPRSTMNYLYKHIYIWYMYLRHGHIPTNDQYNWHVCVSHEIYLYMRHVWTTGIAYLSIIRFY